MSHNTIQPFPTTSVRQCAAFYKAHGFFPVPVPQRRKKAVLVGWPNLRLTPDQLADYFPDDRSQNIGLILAHETGLVDFDLDSPEAVTAGNRWLPPTTWISGRQGKPRSHHWFRTKTPVSYARFDDLDGTRILELRAGNGLQTVVPPSIHEDGDEIVWHELSGEPAALDGAELARFAGEIATLALLKKYWPTVSGQRQDLFMALAGGLARAAWPRGRVEDFLAALCELTGDEEARMRVATFTRTQAKLGSDAPIQGWPTLARLLGPHGEAVVNLARRWLGLAKPDRIAGVTHAYAPITFPALEPFPVEVLPVVLQDFVNETALAMDCDHTFVASPILAVCASLIGTTHVLQVKADWWEWAILWAVTIADSGSKKSPPLKAVLRPVYALQKQKLQAFREAYAAYEQQRAAYEAQQRKTKQSGDAVDGEAPVAPKAARIVVSDITIERLAEVLEDHPKGTLLARDELAGWVGSFTKYKSSGSGSDVPNWLETHAAGTVIVDRKTGDRRSILVDQAATSVTGTIQPGTFARAMSPTLRESGLLARLLTAMPPDRRKRWTDAEVSPACKERYTALVAALDALTHRTETEPHVIRFTPAAKELWVAFYNEWADEQFEAEGELRSHFSKIEAYAPRLALIHHVVTAVANQRDTTAPLSAESMQAGITLARWFAAEARRVYAIFGETEEASRIRKLVEYIHARGGRLTARQLQKANGCKYPSSAEAKAALEELVQLELGSWQQESAGARGPAASTFVLHPAAEDDGEAEESDAPVLKPVGGVGCRKATGTHEPKPVGGVGCRIDAKSMLVAPNVKPVGGVGCRINDTGAEMTTLEDTVEENRSQYSDKSDRFPNTDDLTINPTPDTSDRFRDQGHVVFNLTPDQSDRFSEKHGVMLNPTPDKSDRFPVAGRVTVNPTPDKSDTFRDQGHVAVNPTPDKSDRFPHEECQSVGMLKKDCDGENQNKMRPSSMIETNDGDYVLVVTTDDLTMVQTAVSESRYVGLDLETTGLNPRTDQVRLLALNCDSNGGGRITYLVDCFAVDPQPLFTTLADVELLIHNAAFDLGFLTVLGFTPGIVHDTMLMSQIVYASGHTKGTPPLRHGLKDCVDRELGQTLAKELQASDWSGTLTDEQLTYAAHDAAMLWPLFRQLQQQLTDANLQATATLERETLPALVWLGQNGVPFDYARWCQLADTARNEAERVKAELDGLAQNTGEGLFPVPWNWDSPQQVQQALAAEGIVIDSTRDDVLAGVEHPIARWVRDYREAKKRESTYGRSWKEHVGADGRIYPRWVQLGANSGRMACTAPNMQNLPRGTYRQCIAAPEGRLLVKADYSQIELRIAAKVSGDKALLAAYQRGDDLHTLTAKHVLGIADVTKQHRQLAKAINFGLLYGMGAKSFRAYAKTNYGVELTEREAEGYRDAFFRAYPGLKRWHRSQVDGVSETRTLGGRRVQQVGHFTEKLNLPVQGTGADGLKQALALLWQRRHECSDARPIMAVHDEIVVECPEAQAEAVSTWLRHAMIEAMTPLVAPVPVEVEVSVGRTWGGD